MAPEHGTRKKNWSVCKSHRFDYLKATRDSNVIRN